jgi:uncharacterized protein YndB with AHSA1/START domain
MVTVERTVGSEPDAVWAILGDPLAYPRWVLGITEVRTFDHDWPRPGASFEYGFRWGPLKLSGRATVLAAHPPGHLRMRWRRGLISESTVELTAERVGDLTRIRMAEGAAGLRQGFPANPLVAAVQSGGNVTSVARLGRLADERAVARRRQA